jgi:hypothetical protein
MRSPRYCRPKQSVDKTSQLACRRSQRANPPPAGGALQLWHSFPIQRSGKRLARRLWRRTGPYRRTSKVRPTRMHRLGKMAMPILVPMTAWLPLSSYGTFKASITIGANAFAPLGCGRPRCSIANSSPPSLATIPSSPMLRTSLPATCWSSSSPTGWPNVSLTLLKLSRSRQKPPVDHRYLRLPALPSARVETGFCSADR